MRAQTQQQPQQPPRPDAPPDEVRRGAHRAVAPAARTPESPRQLEQDFPVVQAALGLPEGLPPTDGPYSVCQFESGTLPEPWPHDVIHGTHR